MSHQIIIHMDDDAYAALEAAAAEKGQAVEQLAEKTLVQHFPPVQMETVTSVTYNDFLRELYAAGDILNLPDPSGDLEEVQMLIELASSILPGKPLSEIIIEDRGPR
jgi:hypothetical protein